MKHLDENHHVAGSLHNLIVVVIGARKHWRPIAIHKNAPHAQRLVLYSVGGGAPSLCRLGTLGGSLLSLRSHRRNSSVWRIDDHGCPQIQRLRALTAVQSNLS